ncbi:MAG TPA: sugar transferase [Candidatus Baltobacteraceae bacterium]|jgi:lipopolysaccharide/colanic/teichoic acid biosynthesis glycosyltransferase
MSLSPAFVQSAPIVEPAASAGPDRTLVRTVRGVRAREGIALAIEDALLLAIAVFAVAGWWFGRSDALLTIHAGIAAAGVFAALWLALFAVLGLYRQGIAICARDELYGAGAALAIGMIPQFAVFTYWSPFPHARSMLLAASLAGALSIAAVRWMQWQIGARARARSRRVALIGSAESIERVEALLGHDAPTEIERIVTSPHREASFAPYERARAAGCTSVVATSALSVEALSCAMRFAHQAGLDFALASLPVGAGGLRFRVVKDGRALLLVPQRLFVCSPAGEMLKRTVDIVLALVGLVAFAPAMAVCAVAIAIESGFPVVYAQSRVGRHGRTFEMYKFRTMIDRAERATGAVFAEKNDGRLTRAGRWIRKFSLDELLQIFNILAGDMSIVGPRPERPEFASVFRARFERYDDRQLVRPGLTALSHVNMPRLVDFSRIGERLDYDLFYIENWSPFLDATIVVRTAFEFLFHRTV